MTYEEFKDQLLEAAVIENADQRSQTIKVLKRFFSEPHLDSAEFLLRQERYKVYADGPKGIGWVWLNSAATEEERFAFVEGLLARMDAITSAPPPRQEDRYDENGVRVEAAPQREITFSAGQRLDHALTQGALAAEKSLQRLAWDMPDGRQVSITNGKMDQRFWQTMLVAAKTTMLSPNDAKRFRTGGELVTYVEALAKADEKERRSLQPEISFSDADFRRIINDNSLSSERIQAIVLAATALRTKVTKFLGLAVKKDDGHLGYQEYTSNTYSEFAAVEIIEHSIFKRGRGKGRPEKYYRLFLRSDVALAFYQGLLLKNVELIKNHEPILALPERDFTLYMNLGWLENLPLYRTYEQMVGAAGWKPDEDHPERQRQRLHSILRRLVQANVLKAWHVDPSGRYTIEKN